MIFCPKIKKSYIFKMTDSEDFHRYHTIGFWAIFGGPRAVFAKLPKMLTLILQLHKKSCSAVICLCYSHNIWLRIKNPVCFENLQVISARLHQLIWILLIFWAILKTIKIKKWKFDKKHYKNRYFSNINSIQNLNYLWLYESHRNV